MQRDMLVELDEQMLNDVDGGSLLLAMNNMVYAADVYGYYKEAKYVVTYNATVAEAGRYDLVKPTPTMPQYSLVYMFTR